MRIPFFTFKVVQLLREHAEQNVALYGEDDAWIAKLAGSTPAVRESNLTVGPPPQLSTADADNPGLDAVNARRLFSWLGQLTPTLAMEERLWACLTHHVFPDYMSARWPVGGPATIRGRYLLEGKGFAALSRNGIARLWWAAFLTHDPNRGDPFELTDVLFHRQDIHVSLLERALGKCHVVRSTVLEYLRDHLAELSQESFGRRIQLLLREINLLGGVVILDALPSSKLREEVEAIGRRIQGGLG